MNEFPHLYHLDEIASWQLDYTNSVVELPALQRGFVWKVNQIEALWDSVLRGFPIGAFLLSKSEDDNLFLLDGQQRATSIAIGYYNPWLDRDNNSNKFWSVKNIPCLWIDLDPKEKTSTQKFVLRVTTQSHPWGYQRINNSSILSISDRRNALKRFRENPINENGKYIQLYPQQIYPYDSNIPVPLIFLIESIHKSGSNWKKELILKCRENLPTSFIKTKHHDGDYILKLQTLLDSDEFDDSFFLAINNLKEFAIPGISIKKEVLNKEDEHAEDPTLFVRLNASGTKIGGEELMYSIYKASFPEAKKLVENIGLTFIAPSMVITLVARIAYSELNNNSYPYPIKIKEFQKRIQEQNFKNKMRNLIGNEDFSPAGILFKKAFEILLSSDDVGVPPVLVKNIIKNSPELFLLLIQWVNLNKHDLSDKERQKILACVSALAWFGRDNTRMVRELWLKINLPNFWSKEVINSPSIKNSTPLICPLIEPSTLRSFLVKSVIEERIIWDNLYPKSESEIGKQFQFYFLSIDPNHDSNNPNLLNEIWDSFLNKLFSNKSIVLFAQRNYINETFGEFNQIETLEDTNTPWDWDHIYPYSWVSGKWNIDQNTRQWTNCIGNLRAISLEDNRSESNYLSPKIRLSNVQEQSFIKYNDWEFWNKIDGRINNDNQQMVGVHLNAIVHRLCNLYEEWYKVLNIGDFFNFHNN